MSEIELIWRVLFTVIVSTVTFFLPAYLCYEIKRSQKNYEQSQGVFI